MQLRTVYASAILILLFEYYTNIRPILKLPSPISCHLHCRTLINFMCFYHYSSCCAVSRTPIVCTRDMMHHCIWDIDMWQCSCINAPNTNWSLHPRLWFCLRRRQDTCIWASVCACVRAGAWAEASGRRVTVQGG